MQRIIYFVMAMSLMMAMVSCGNSVTTVGEFDYQTFSKPEEAKKWFDDVVGKIGNNNKVMDEITFSIERPSKEGIIKHEGEKDYISISIVYQNESDKRNVTEINYFGNTNGWNSPVEKELQIIGSDAETFNLEDELFDFSQVTLDIFNKIMSDAIKQYKDDTKYEYQYISYIQINIGGFKVDIKGKLKSNAQEKTESYQTDLKGTPIE